jgi:type II secretory pathway pseudopilin PulG
MTKRCEKGMAGFSLVELLIAMLITLVALALASALLASEFNVRARENRRSEALADAQHTLNIMSREIANSGFGLTTNGIVAADSDTTSIRVRANLNANSVVSDADEDVKFGWYVDTAPDPDRSYIVRKDTNGATAVLANIDLLRIRYYAAKVDYVTNTAQCDINAPGTTAPPTEVADKSTARYIVISVCVTLPAVGTPGATGYQPPSQVQLVSDVALRDGNLLDY